MEVQEIIKNPTIYIHIILMRQNQEIKVKIGAQSRNRSRIEGQSRNRSPIERQVEVKSEPNREIEVESKANREIEVQYRNQEVELKAR